MHIVGVDITVSRKFVHTGGVDTQNPVHIGGVDIPKNVKCGGVDTSRLPKYYTKSFLGNRNQFVEKKKLVRE